MSNDEQATLTIQSRTAFILLLTTAVLFILKYSSRITPYPWAVAVGYVAMIATLLLIIRLFRDDLSRSVSALQFQMLVMAIAALLCVAVQFVPAETGSTRFIAIHEWLNDVGNGVYPHNHVGGASGFPVLFLIALPFRTLGNLGYMEVAGFLIFGLIAVRCAKTNADAMWQVALLLMLPSFLWEFVVRSEVFFNMTLCLALILVAERLGIRDLKRRHFFFMAVTFGLVLSTRSIVVIVFAIYLLFSFRQRISRLIVFSVIAGSVFLLTLVPLVVWDYKAFRAYGPFAIQLSYLPKWLSVGFVGLSCLAGWKAKNLRDVFFLTGCIMFAMTTASFVFYIRKFGWTDALYLNEFDVSYYVFCTPFLLLALTFGQASQRPVSQPEKPIDVV